MKEFVSPEEPLGNLDAGAVSRLISTATDIALILDQDGTVHDVSISSDGLAGALKDNAAWAGRRWTECATPDSRLKMETLLRDSASGPTRWTQISHASKSGGDIPISYAAAPVGRSQRIVAFGRDLRSLSALQQRLIETQQSMERDYLRLRHVETRYRLLFDMSSEALLVLDAATEKPVEINPAARLLLGDTDKRIMSHAFQQFFDQDSIGRVQSLLGVVRATGRGEPEVARLALSGKEVSIIASLFRQETALQILVRLFLTEDSAVQAAISDDKSKLLTAAESAPDGFAITSQDGRVLVVNAAFADMVQLANEEQLRGTSLEQWLGRQSVDLNVLIANLRQGGAVRLFATQLRGAFGTMADVEISAVSHGAGKEQIFIFVIRDVGRRISGEARVGRDLPRSVEQMTELIGRVPLKDLVREATDLIERLCIEAALELTADNRASAAELLGLSRQSLYVKLRRYGLGELDADGTS